MKVLKNIIKFIIMIILVVCFLFIGIFRIATSTLFDKNYVLKNLEDANFYAETYDLVKSNFEKYIYQSGLDEEVLDNICTEEKVKEDINLIISNIYEGTETKIDTTEIAENLNNNINKTNVMTSKNKAAIEQFVTHICDEYKETILHTNYESKINHGFEKINNILQKIYKVVIIVTIISIIILFILNGKKISKDIQNLGIMLFSTGTICLCCSNVFISKVDVNGIKIFNDTFSKVIIAIISDILQKIVSFGMGILVIGTIFIAIYVITVACKKVQEDKEREEL